MTVPHVIREHTAPTLSNVLRVVEVLREHPAERVTEQAGAPHVVRECARQGPPGPPGSGGGGGEGAQEVFIGAEPAGVDYPAVLFEEIEIGGEPVFAMKVFKP